MTRKRKIKKQRKIKKKIVNPSQKFKYPILTSRVKRWIVAILMFVFSLVISLSFFEKAGTGGEFLFRAFYFLI